MTNNEYKLIAFAFLSKEAHWNVNKNLCKIVGVEAALIMADLISKNDYFEKNNMLHKDGLFFNTNENISQDTCLSLYSVKEGIKKLKTKNFISVVRAGMPSKNHFLIHFSALIDEISQLANFQPTSRSNIDQQVGQFSANINNNKEEELNNKNLNIITETSSGENSQSDLFGEIPEEPKEPETQVKVMTLRQQVIDFWLKEFHVGWNFNATDGKKINSLIVKLKKSLSNKRGEYTEQDVFELFKTFCLKLPEFYKTKTLSILDSNYDSIIEEIKSNRNGTKQTSTQQAKSRSREYARQNSHKNI